LLLVTAHVKVCHLAYVMGRIGLCVFCLLKFSVAMCILLIKKLESMLFCVRVNIVSGDIIILQCRS